MKIGVRGGTGAGWPGRRRAAGLMLPAVALAVTLGAGTAHAANPGISWHKLTGLNGWHAGSAMTGGPEYAVSGGVVYLSGSVTSKGTNPLVAVLPRAARPGQVLYLTVYTRAGRPGTLRIDPGGNILAAGGTAAFAFTSLAGVSFPATSMGTLPISLRNGWASAQAQFSTGDPGYSVSHGIAYLSGSLHQPAGTASEFAVLPAAVRPASDLSSLTCTMSSGPGTVSFERDDGVISAYRGRHRKFTSLAGLSYPLTRGREFRLMNGWHSAIMSQPATYQVRRGVVYLTGAIDAIKGSASLFAMLPPGARPKHDLYFTASTRAFTAGTVKISPAGAIYAYSQVPSHARNYTSLTGISYPLGS